MTPVNSPPASAGTPPHALSNDPESRIFQFPPPEHLQRSCREDWSLLPSFRPDPSCIQVTSTSPMAISPADLSTLNTPRSSLVSVPSRTSPMNTDPATSNPEPTVVEDFLHFFEDDINFTSNAAFSSSYPMNFDNLPISGFPSPPGSGYSSPVPAYMDSITDLPSIVSVGSYEIDCKLEPDVDCNLMSPYSAAALRHRADLYVGAASSTPGQLLSYCFVRQCNFLFGLKFLKLFNDITLQLMIRKS